MKKKLFRPTLTAILAVVLLLLGSVGYVENIDPYDDNSQYAYGENVGWLNLEPGGDGGPGVEVGDSALTGYIWGENIGWINLSPTYGGVVNDGTGNLSGYAWGENVGWINFAPMGGGVTIDPATGEFSGYAWGENIGWINFALVQDRAKTAWIILPILRTINYRFGEPEPGFNMNNFPIYRYWMNVKIENIGDGNAFNVTASISSWPPNAILPIPDGNVTVGDILAGNNAWSSDTYTIELDLLQPGGGADQGITWTIEYDDSIGQHHVIEDVPEFPTAP
ncbi:hypothetical protein H8E77_21300 [bacterium]|nr:hypothetical protein [bacterium]